MRVGLVLAGFMMGSIFMMPLAIAQNDAGTDEPGAASCQAQQREQAVADFDANRAQCEARYRARQSDFRPKMLVHADALSRCVERALRRGPTPDSSTAFGIQVAATGRISKIVVLEANHSDSLYGACLVRALCPLILEPPAMGADEVFTFNMRRKLKPHQRPWSLDPLAPR